MARLTPEQALARLQPQGKRKAKGNDPLIVKTTIGRSDEDICIIGNSKGDILVPLNDKLPDTLGIWEQGGDMPPAMIDWIAEYASEVEWWENVGESLQTYEKTDLPNKAPKAPRQDIPPMLTTKWGQTSPYNDTLTFDGKKCVTGCNTTAVAQIMKHWFDKGYQRGCPPTDPYITSTNGYEVGAMPAKIVFDFENLVRTPKTAKQKAAVQELMEYLAKTFHSDFTPNSTGASPKKVAEYLKCKLRMGEFISYIHASKLGLSSYENFIYNELLQGRPVIIAGWTGNGGGHTFVVDGYDATQDLYHVNWGWNGSYDGWFKLSALNPTSSRAYNSNKVAIIGIQPDYKLGDVNGDGDIDIADAMQVVRDAQSGKYSDASEINYDGRVTVTDAQVIISKIIGK